jgi:hypothetical protein
MSGYACGQSGRHRQVDMRSGSRREGEDVGCCEAVRGGREPVVLVDRFLGALALECYSVAGSSGESCVGTRAEYPGVLENREDGISCGRDDVFGLGVICSGVESR